MPETPSNTLLSLDDFWQEFASTFARTAPPEVMLELRKVWFTGAAASMMLVYRTLGANAAAVSDPASLDAISGEIARTFDGIAREAAFRHAAKPTTGAVH